MSNSLRATFALAGESLSSAIIDKEAFSRISTLCEQLPAGFSTFWGFESRLGEREPSVDVLFEAKRHSRGHAFLAGQSRSSIDGLCEQWPTWHRLRDFAGAWAQEEHPFARHIRNIWLEFDVAKASGDSDVIANPCIFWGADRDFPWSEAFLDLFLSEMSSFQPTSMRPNGLASLVSSLPGPARVFQIGMMISREVPVVRICVNRLAGNEVESWLDGLDWKGDGGALDDVVEALSPLTQSIAVDLDLTPTGLSEKIGLECYVDSSNNDVEQWKPLFDYIENLELCLLPKRRAIEAFPRVMPLASTEGHTEGIIYPSLHLSIHHLKLNFTEGALSEAKAYLGVYRPGVHVNRIYGNDSSPSGKNDAWGEE